MIPGLFLMLILTSAPGIAVTDRRPPQPSGTLLPCGKAVVKATFVESPPVTLTPDPWVRKVEDRAYSVPAGGVFAFWLESSPGTGYSWSLAQAPKAAIGRLTATWVPPPPRQSVGGRSEQMWEFRALAAGKTRFTLVYSRAWEGAKPRTRTVNAEVSVTKAAAAPSAPPCRQGA